MPTTGPWQITFYLKSKGQEGFDYFLFRESMTLDHTECDMEKFRLWTRHNQVSSVSLKGQVENNIMEAPRREGLINMRVYSYDDVLELKSFLMLNAHGTTENDGSFPDVSGSEAGALWFQYDTGGTGFAETYLTTAGSQGDTSIVVLDQGYAMDEVTAWLIISCDQYKDPHYHAFTIGSQSDLGTTRQLNLEQPLIMDFPQYSLVVPLYNLGPSVITQAEFLEAYDDDMQYYRAQLGFREIHSGWRFNGLFLET